jgi:hypothetical protein
MYVNISTSARYLAGSDTLNYIYIKRGLLLNAVQNDMPLRLLSKQGEIKV